MALAFINTAETDWLLTTISFKDATSLNVQVGDLLVACSSYDSSGRTLNISGGGTWTQRLTQSGATGQMFIHSLVVSAANAALVPRVSRSGTGGCEYGAIIYQFRGSTGLGVSASTSGTGIPQVTMPTLSQANSALVVFATDSNFSGSVTWLTNAGLFSERIDNEGDSVQSIHSGYHPDTGSASSYVAGQSAPSGQVYVIGAIEVMGSAAPPPLIPVGWFTA